MNVPSGWQPSVPRSPSSRSRLSPTSLFFALADADHATGTPVGQPVEQDRADRVQTDLQRDRWGPTAPARAWGQVGKPGGEPGQDLCGQ